MRWVRDTCVVRAVASSGAGFLLAVMWFDLMFDVQLLSGHDQRRSEEVLTSIGQYYRRVTTDARPMNRLVALGMLVTLAAIITELARGAAPAWGWWVSLALAAVLGLAGWRTVPSAVRLGSNVGTAEERLTLARGILRDHLVCLGCVAALLGVLLGGT